MSEAVPRWLRVGAGLGSAGVLLVALFLPGLAGLIVFDTPETSLTDPQGYSIVPYAAACFLFPVNAAIFAWLWSVALSQPAGSGRAGIAYFVVAGSGLMLLGMTGLYLFLIRDESGRVPFVVLVWFISVHLLGAVGTVFLVLALRRWRAVTS